MQLFHFLPVKKRKKSTQKKKVFRSLYLMKRMRTETPKSVRPILFIIHWLIPLSWSGKYKIGISYSTKKRRGQVDRALKGGVVTVLSVPLLFTEQIEGFLHKVFKQKQYWPRRAGKGAGKSEHFKLNLLEVILLKLLMIFFWATSNIVYVILFGAIIYYHILR